MYIEANGLVFHYEKSGQGKPLVLLHGNGENLHIFDALRQKLQRNFTVYALDSRGHGQSAQNAPLDYREMARDVIDFICQLNLPRPSLLGFSDGGILGLLVASAAPDLLSRLVVCGANTRVDGIRWPDILLMKLGHFFTRDEKLHLMLTQPEIPPRQLEKIQTPTLVVAGQRDMVSTRHTCQLAAHIPHSTLYLLPGENHFSYLRRSAHLYRAVRPFLTRA